VTPRDRDPATDQGDAHSRGADRLAQVELRLQALEDERAVLHTLYAYGHTMDHGPRAEFVDCFTEMAVWRSEKTGRHGLPPRQWTGRGAIARLWDRHTHAPELHHKHLLSEPRLTFAGDECRAVSYYVRIDEHQDGPFIRAFGRYCDLLVRCEDGRWRLAERINESEGATLEKGAELLTTGDSD